MLPMTYRVEPLFPILRSQTDCRIAVAVFDQRLAEGVSPRKRAEIMTLRKHVVGIMGGLKGNPTPANASAR
jgi:hypothetical protein